MPDYSWNDYYRYLKLKNIVPVKTALLDFQKNKNKKLSYGNIEGYKIPLYFTSPFHEHKAVREHTGIFDFSHKGLLEIQGETATDFLNIVTTNDIYQLKDGQSHYSFILEESGNVLDFIRIFKIRANDYMMVISSGNTLSILKYLRLIKDGIILKRPKKIYKRLFIKELGGCGIKKDCKMIVSLQGPKSIESLKERLNNKSEKENLGNLRYNNFEEFQLADRKCLISRSGNTGQKTGYDIFININDGIYLWRDLTESEEYLTAESCGYLAENSLRVEAGIPAFGRELGGIFLINPIEAGYERKVSWGKDFIGREKLYKKKQKKAMKVVRAEFPFKNNVEIRHNDSLLDNGICTGWITSAAVIGEKQICLGYVAKESADKKKNLQVRLTQREGQMRERESFLRKGVRAKADLEGKIVSRFKRFL